MLPACASLTIVAAMSEESVMKQALPSEVPARVRRGQFRAITLGLGASVLAMACSFGEIDNDPIDENDVDPGQNTDVQQPEDNGDDQGPTTGGPSTSPRPSDSQAVDPDAPPFNPDEDPFSTEMGQQ